MHLNYLIGAYISNIVLTFAYIGIEARDERLACLSYAEECCLDVPAITKCVVERIRARESTEFDTTGDLAKEFSTNAVSRINEV